MQPPTGPWPLSAAAAMVLRVPESPADHLLRLTLKELVLRRVWALERVEQRRLGRTRVRTLLSRTGAPRPDVVPLGRLDDLLRGAVGDEGDEVRAAVSALPRPTAEDIRDEVRYDLVERGLITVTRRRSFGPFATTDVETTDAGRAWADETYARESALEASIGRRPDEVAAQVGTLGALVLLATPALVEAIDDAFLRLDGAAPTGILGDFDSSAFDLGDLGAFDGGGGRRRRRGRWRRRRLTRAARRARPPRWRGRPRRG